jgi:hypothetical protein
MGRIGNFARWTARRFVPGSQQLSCSACGQLRSDRIELVAGLSTYLCSECVERGARQLAPRRPPVDGRRCQFCRNLRAPNEVTQVGAVRVCADCLGIMVEMLAANRDSTPRSQ